MTGDNVTKKTIVVKSGDTWEYDETPELKAALAKLHGQRLAVPPRPRKDD